MGLQSDILNQAGEVYRKALQEESTAQGHYLTGSLQRRQTLTVSESPDRSSAALSMPGYGFYVNNGVAPANVPFQEGSGAKHSKYIDALTRFWELRGLVGQEAVSAAFALAKKHKREGMPTNGSYLFSRTGQRKNFVEVAIKKNQVRVKSIISTGIKTEFRRLFKQVK